MFNPLGWFRNRNPEKVQRNVMLDAFMRDVIVALTVSCEPTLGKEMWNTLPFFNVDYMNAAAVHEVIDDIGKNNPMLNVSTVEVDEIVEAIQATPGAQQLGATPEQIRYSVMEVSISEALDRAIFGDFGFKYIMREIAYSHGSVMRPPNPDKAYLRYVKSIARQIVWRIYRAQENPELIRKHLAKNQRRELEWYEPYEDESLIDYQYLQDLN